jgi:hypothetical protein
VEKGKGKCGPVSNAISQFELVENWRKSDDAEGAKNQRSKQ